LATFILSSGLALIAYVLALTRVWWGPSSETEEELSAASLPVVNTNEPRLIQATIVALVALLLIAGLWPNGFQILGGGGVR
jgi:formate hydrogenlyase subunit 3/multisubunit Na+/H+ antiporter MnhD subunit